MSVEASTKNNCKHSHFRNRYSSDQKLKDVDAPNPKENDILVRQGDKFRTMPISEVAEIAPPVIYGGEF